MKFHSILNFAIFYCCFDFVQSLDLRSRGMPVPHARELDNMLSRFLNFTELDGTVFRYLFGLESDSIDGIDPENLNINILDADTVAKIVRKAHRRFQTSKKNNTRRYHEDESEVVNNQIPYIEKMLDMMVQSIYMANLRMRETKPYRDKFRNKLGYNMAIMFGALMSIRTKMEELYAVMCNFQKKTHFLWYLIIYEKILAFHVDVTNMVEKIFQMYEDRRSWNAGAPEDLLMEENQGNVDNEAEKISVEKDAHKNNH